MNPHPPAIDDIDLAALEQSSELERRAYPDEACAGDHALRQRFERLLQAQSNVGSFLEAPALRLAPAPVLVMDKAGKIVAALRWATPRCRPRSCAI